MYINRIEFLNNIKYKENKINTNLVNCSIERDTFEKGNKISFKGIAEKSFGNRREDASISAYLGAHSSKRNKENLAKIRMPIREYNHRFEEIDTGDLPGFDFINQRLEDSGITTTTLLNYFLRLYNNPDVLEAFYTHETKLLEIYSKLNSKEDITKFPDLLFGLYMKSQNEEKNFNPNTTIDFLKSVGVEKYSDIQEKFAYIGEYFNNFENVSDTIEAIEYLQITYPRKIELINSVKPKQGNSQPNISAERIYAKYNDVVDYLYEENNGENIEPLPMILDSLIKFSSFKRKDYYGIPSQFNDAKSPKDKVNFLLYLDENNVTTDLFKQIPKHSIITDVDCAAIIERKDDITKEISLLKGVNSDKAEIIYAKFAPLYAAVDNDAIKSLTDLIDKFEFSNTESFLSIYNRFYGIAKKKIDKNELIEFIELMNYCDSKSVISEARKQKVRPIDLVIKNKEDFYGVKDAIEEFLVNDDTEYFIGQSPYSIYSKYKELLIENTDNVQSVLSGIARLNISDSSDYKLKTERVKNLSQYFDSREEFTEFILQNDIKFDLSSSDDKCIENCTKIFSLLSSDEDKDTLKYYTGSNFIAKSKSSLNKFFEKYTDETKQKEMLQIFAERQVPSYQKFILFLNKYKTGKDDTDNIMLHLNSQPKDMDFITYSKKLDGINAELQKYGIPFNVNNSNILKLSFDKEYSDVYTILNSIFDAKDDENFITKLSSTFRKRNHVITGYDIAEEIASQYKTENEACYYNNIMKKLGLTFENPETDDEKKKFSYKMSVAQALPEDFIKFVNSDDWFNFNPENNPPCISLHARLRLIDRFGLDGDKTLDDLYSKETSDNIKNLLKTIYTSKPLYVIGRGYDKNKSEITDTSKQGIVMRTMYNSDMIDSVFTPYGFLVTIINKSK